MSITGTDFQMYTLADLHWEVIRKDTEKVVAEYLTQEQASSLSLKHFDLLKHRRMK